MLLHNLTENRLSVAGLLTDLANDLMMITSEGTMIRTPVKASAFAAGTPRVSLLCAPWRAKQ